jgi:hypothetical protein
MNKGIKSPLSLYSYFASRKSPARGESLYQNGYFKAYITRYSFVALRGRTGNYKV